MELNFSRLLIAVSINILDFNDLGFILDNFNKSINLIDFNQVNNFLLEEFTDSFINFSSELGILDEQSLQFASKQMQQMFGSGVLNWDFHSLLGEITDEDCSFFGFVGLNLLSLEDIEDVALHIYSDVGIIDFKLFDALLVDTSSSGEVFFESF